MNTLKGTQPSSSVQDGYQSISLESWGRRGRNNFGNVLRQQTQENAVRHGSGYIDYARNDLAGVFHTCH